MSHKYLALFLAGLSTTALAAPVETRDNRTAIQVTAAERNQTLYEMREFLHGMFNIQNALARKDMKAVAISARPMGPMLHRMPASLRDRLPEEFTQMSVAMHETFDVMARDAETKADMGRTQSQLGEALTYCSGCHDTYRFEVVAFPFQMKKK